MSGHLSPLLRGVEVRGRTFIAYAVAVSLGEQVVLFAVTLVLLPSAGIEVPAWLVIVLSIVLAAQSVVLTRINSRTLDRRPLFTPDAGVRARAMSRLEPSGYVRVENELWGAVTEGPHIEKDEVVVVLRREGMRLIVARASAETSDRRLVDEG